MLHCNLFHPAHQKALSDKPRLLNSLLANGQPAIGELERKLKIHRSLLQAIRRVVPAFLQDHCIDCVVRRDRGLLLFTDAAAWAAQLRFYRPAMLQALRLVDPAFARIEIRIMMTPSQSAHRSRVPNRITKESIANIIVMAQDQQHHALKQALERLAATMTRRFYDR